MPELKEKIKSLRESRKLTQAALGALVGESQVTVGGWEKGRTTPNIDQLRRLSEALEVPLTELVDTGEAVLQTGTPYFPDVNASAGLNFLSLQNKPYSVPISIPNVKADAFINVFGDSKNQPIIFLHGEPGYNCANFEATPTQQLTNHNFYVIVYDRRGKEEARLLQQHTFFKNPSTI